MQRLGRRWFETGVAGVDGAADVVRQALTVVAKTELVVRLVQVPVAPDRLRFPVALEARSRQDVEDAVGALAEVRQNSPADWDAGRLALASGL